MGLMDRDYMHEKSRRSRPFSPPPERFKLGTLGMVLVFVALLFFLYKVADWKLHHRPAPQPVAESAPQPARPSIPAPRPTFSMQPAYPGSSNAAAGISQVTKCVTNGRTSYGDASCPQGSVSSQVTTRENHNLMAAVRPTAASPAEASATNPPIVEVRSRFTSEAAAKKMECEWLGSQIKHWDSMARQPQVAQMQDWISEQRKQARDRQFRIRCR